MIDDKLNFRTLDANSGDSLSVRRCPKCDAALAPGLTHCTQCGYTVAQSQTAKQAGAIPIALALTNLPDTTPSKVETPLETHQPLISNEGINRGNIEVKSHNVGVALESKPVEIDISGINKGKIEVHNYYGFAPPPNPPSAPESIHDKLQDYEAEINELFRMFGSMVLSNMSSQLDALRARSGLPGMKAHLVEERVHTEYVRKLSEGRMLFRWTPGDPAAASNPMSLAQVVVALNNLGRIDFTPRVDVNGDGEWRNAWQFTDIVHHPELKLRCASSGRAISRGREVVCDSCGKLFENRYEIFSNLERKCHICSGKRPTSITSRDQATRELLLKLSSEQWIDVRGGTFTIGSPISEVGRKSAENQCHVSISKSFKLMRTPVTTDLYYEIMCIQPGDGDPEYPATMVSWRECLEFCNRLSDREGFDRCYELDHEQVRWRREVIGFRLPTESEWEYACRAGSTGNLPDGVQHVSECAVFGVSKIEPVGSYAANNWGFHDMLGLIWEWTWDDYRNYPPESRNLDVYASRDQYKSCRGGSFLGLESDCRCARRDSRRIDARQRDLGFRVAITIK